MVSSLTLPQRPVTVQPDFNDELETLAMIHTHTVFDKTLRERIFHVLAFKDLAVLLTAPVLPLVMNKPLAHMGALAPMFFAVAMFWNMFFNDLFDRAQRYMGFQHTLQVRVLHAMLFKLELIVVLIPLTAWWLSIGLVEASLLDIGLILFFPPYTMAFDWSYDVLHARLVESHQTKATGCNAG